MSKFKNDVGYIGESLACKYLIKNNYKILNRNYHTKYGEIDIIAKNNYFLVFTEVKVRKINSIVSGIEAVDTKKQKKIIKTAMIYLTDNNLNLQPRFDVIEIVYYLKSNSKFLKTINHIINAFSWEDDYNHETF